MDLNNFKNNDKSRLNYFYHFSIQLQSIVLKFISEKRIRRVWYDRLNLHPLKDLTTFHMSRMSLFCAGHSAVNSQYSKTHWRCTYNI